MGQKGSHNNFKGNPCKSRIIEKLGVILCFSLIMSKRLLFQKQWLH